MRDEEQGHEVSAITPAPVIVLVRPQLGQNIGAVARAMLNFGLTELRLVAPRDGWPNPEAGPAAAGADIVLAEARVFERLSEALDDCSHVYATTVRQRGIVKPVVTPEAAMAEIRAAPGQSAILFGPERSGLETDDVALAAKILTIPVNPAFGSLNLAQAVLVAAYEWSRGAALAMPTKVDKADEPPASFAELAGLIEQLEGALDTAGYFRTEDRRPATMNTIRTIMAKPQWSSREVRAVRGILRTLAEPRRR